MKLVILTEYYPSGSTPGSGAFVHARVKLYRQLGHEILIVHNPKPGLPACEEIEGARVVRPESEAAGQALIESFAPDAIAIHFPYRGTLPARLGASLQGRYRVVAWLHGYETMYTAFFGYHHGLNWLLSIPHDWLKLRYLRRFLKECDAVVYVSAWLRRLTERNLAYGHPRSFVIANPVDTQLFTPAGPFPAAKELRGVALRSLGPKYGLDIAIRAYAGVAETGLTIVGKGPLEATLQSLTEHTRSNTRLLTQHIPHTRVPDLLRSYDYFVAPSRNETQGVAMCEAMSCGLPVVATRVGGIPEFVRDGLDGYLVPPENPAALREAILRLVHDPARCRAMGQNARQHMLELCDGPRIAAQELQVLRGDYGNRTAAGK
jgi:glycosyltransferase involved in cell wall biosynthesis